MKKNFILIWLMFLLVLFSGIKVSASETRLESAPNFSLNDFQGNKFTLSDELKNSEAVLLWFTNFCGGCTAKLPEMERIKNLYEKKAVKVVAVSVLGEDRKTVEDVIQKKAVTLKVLFDPQGIATQLFSGKQVTGTCPLENLFIINKSGKIIFASHYPGIQEDEIEHILNKRRGD